jgi:hypothetical protein
MKELFTSKNVQKTEQAELKSTSEAVSKALSEAEKNSIYIQEKMKGIKKE